MKRLQDLAARLAKSDNEDGAHRDRLWLGRSGLGIFVEFFGNPADEPFEELCKSISEPNVAPRITTLILRGPDEGANGTCNWDMERLANASATYRSLKTLSIEQGRPGDHNAHILGTGFEEGGVLGRLLEKMPSLEVLASPSSPDESFFATAARPLQLVSVNAGYDHQDFVRNLANAINLPELRTLEYGEASGASFEGIERTAFDAYFELLRSTSVRLERVVLRNPSLSSAELRELKLSRPDLQLMVVRCEAQYVG